MAGTVTVGCKMPNGLILRLFEMVKQNEAIQGGFREVEIARQVGPEIVLKGVAAPFGSEKPLTGGYALTQGVDADFFGKWMEQNKGSDLVQNRIVIVHGSDTRGAARESEAVETGLEPLKQAGDRRAPRGKGGVSTPEKAAA